MIKFPESGNYQKKLICANPLDNTSSISDNCGGQTLALSVNELGKQLLKSAADGDVEKTRGLVCLGALFTADWLGTSPLHLAARNNHLEICEILLKAGISQDARTKVDKTSLHMAATEGHADIVELLLDYGANPDCRDLLGMTPLHWAVQNSHPEVVTILLRHGAQTDIVNKFDLTPGDIALQVNRVDLMGQLTDSRVHNLTLQLDTDEVQMTAIEDSTSNSSIPLETILLEEVNNSIDPETLNSDQKSNIDSNFAESIRILQEHGITMLPHEDNNILTTVMKTGHSVVLTDVGKEVLKSVKDAENAEKIITIIPEAFASSTSTNDRIQSKRVIQEINGKLVPKIVKRVVITNKNMGDTETNDVGDDNHTSDKSTAKNSSIMAQLVKAQKTIEEYKMKLLEKDEEIERYKEQIMLLSGNS